MKLYQTKAAPNPRRVRMFLAEKNRLDSVEFVELDLAAGENLTDDYRQKSFTSKVPTLELDDGSFISESVAICRYFEVLSPEPALMGTGALEQAQIEMWQRRVEFHLFLQVGMCFQHTTGYFKDRMRPFPDFGEECGRQALEFMQLLDRRLASTPYIAGERFSIVDITAVCAIDFARVVKLRMAEDWTDLRRWHAAVSARPSAGA